MASNEQRKLALEALELEEIRRRCGWFGASALKKSTWSKAKIIAALLNDVGHRDQGDCDRFDQRLGLPTDREQDLRHQENATQAAVRSANAAEDSARSAKIAVGAKWVSIGISLAALFVSILAIGVSIVVASLTSCTGSS